MLNGSVITRAKLLSVEQVKIQNLTAEFLEYDTDGGKYKLPRTGNYLKLTFLKPGQEMHLFTTLRSDRPGKIDYYLSRIGELFEVVLTQETSAP
jgi:hypothetical protein